MRSTYPHLLYSWLWWVGGSAGACLLLSLGKVLPFFSLSTLFAVLIYSQIFYFAFLWPSLYPVEDQGNSIVEMVLLLILGLPLGVVASPFAPVDLALLQGVGLFLILLATGLTSAVAVKHLKKEGRSLYLFAIFLVAVGAPMWFFFQWQVDGQYSPHIYAISPFGAVYALWYHTADLHFFFTLWFASPVISGVVVSIGWWRNKKEATGSPLLVD